MALIEQLLIRWMAAAAWLGPWLLFVLLVFCAVAGWWRRRRHMAGTLGAWRWPSWALLTAIQIFAIAGLVMSFGPGKGIVSELRSLQHQVGEPIAELEFKSLSEGTPVSLESLRGQVVLLNVWATWCPPCIAEMPALEQVQSDLGERGLAVVMVSDESREHLQSFFADRPTAVTQLYTAGLPPWLGSSARPKSLLIDRQGVLREYVFGAHDASFFSDWAEPLLGGVA